MAFPSHVCDTRGDLRSPGSAAAVRKDEGGWRALQSGPSAGLECYSSINSSTHLHKSRVASTQGRGSSLYFSIQAGMYTHSMVCCQNEC